VSALCDGPTREIVLSAGYRHVLAALMKEALSVFEAAGIAPARLGAVPLPWIVRIMALPTPLVRLVAGVQLRIDLEARWSMWEDLMAARLTEVYWINGEIVRLADSCGARAERNRRIVEVVHAAEKAGRGSPKMSADALWQAITAGGVS